MARILVVPAVAAILIGGLYVAAGRITNDYYLSIALAVVWFVVASAVMGKLVKRHAPQLRTWVRAGTIGTSVVVVAWFYWTSIRETTVNERVATAEPPPAASDMRPAGDRPPPAPRNVLLAEGAVESLAHDGEGRAQVIELAAGGRVLTLTDFDIDPGPQVEVRLVAGDGSHLALGDLKGSRGDQQYDVPRDADLDVYDTVVFWCIPFSQALAEARLSPA
ncbi:MAG TPA: DM13 domain-containing protein [Solirubrobacteraceae bacterium]|nr:DM13 domain-containing protein [Solirubrobacteraceae bacterium]